MTDDVGAAVDRALAALVGAEASVPGAAGLAVPRPAGTGS